MQEVFCNKVAPKKFLKIDRKICMPASFFSQVTGYSLCYCEFCKIFKKDNLVEHVKTAASDILGYRYIGVSPARSTLRKCTVSFSILGRGGALPCPFLKIEKSSLILQKSALIFEKCALFVCIYGLKFSFKMQF